MGLCPSSSVTNVNKSGAASQVDTPTPVSELGGFEVQICGAELAEKRGFIFLWDAAKDRIRPIYRNQCPRLEGDVIPNKLNMK